MPDPEARPSSPLYQHGNQPPRTICAATNAIGKQYPRAQGTPDTDVDRTEESAASRHPIPPQAAPTLVVPPIG